MKNNKRLTIILECAQILLGIIMLIGLFYIRLIPRISRDLWENMTDNELIITLVIMLLILSNIYNLLNIFLASINQQSFPKSDQKY
jgi:uncharacterized membrane protein (DUF373 family)